MDEQLYAAGSVLVGLRISVGDREVPGVPAAAMIHGTTRSLKSNGKLATSPATAVGYVEVPRPDG
ncbi:MAG: hypothetical protein EPN69_09330 [Rhodanobacter sp.]|nr:MAG: hypothetical protein EPN71_16810 [Rhodanobacter sp.]TAL91695.1 MAG: hypothetical protein EPN69_09330 [Rhodanobacter sp.]TAM42533.1 MAG: hypothetical protein EPN58_02655 [Rhodanobacter sp.]TAN26190.1 MAG: hypothetical protein EPN32_07855 [Rhodanobacter sp.]